jgi:hypothetical protein
MSNNAVRWVIAVIVALGIVALLAWRRGDPGVGERIPDPEDATAVVLVLERPAPTLAESLPPTTT